MPLKSWQYAALIAVMGALVLLVAGFSLGALPYVRGEAAFSDSVTAHLPAAHHLRQFVRDGDGWLPLWQNAIMAGQPFAANPLNKTAYPLQWLALILPPTLHLNLLILLHMVIAAAGMWRWASSLGLRTEATALATLAFVLSPRLLGHTAAGHLDILYALAWWVWLMWAVRCAVHEEGRFALHGVRVGLFGGLVFLSDVRVSLFAFLAAGVYVLVELAQVRKWSRLLRFVPAGVLAFIIGMAVWMPVLDWGDYTNRVDLTLEDAGTLALEPGMLVGMVLAVPDIQQEQVTYFGLTVGLLALVGWWMLPRRWMLLWLVTILLVVLYAMGLNAPLWGLLAGNMPGLSRFRVPSRIWLILALTFPLLAGYGLQRMMTFAERLQDGDKPSGVGRLRLAAVALTVGLLACGGFTLVALSADLGANVGIGLLVGGLTLGAVLLLTLSGRLPPSGVALAFLVIVFVDLGWYGVNLLQWRGTDFWQTPYEPLAERLLDEDAARVYSPAYSVQNQVAELYGLRVFGGVDPFQLTGIERAIEAGSGVPVEEYSPVLPPLTGVEDDDLSTANINAEPDTEVLAQWGVSHIVAPYDIDHTRLELLDTIAVQERDERIYLNLDYDGQSATEWASEVVNDPDYNLPSNEVIATLNQRTQTAHIVTMVSVALSAVALLVLSLYQREA